mmetsp:Transcript_43002/g.143162  ORF Transcript_43002/g.143162 Transcript_43002/m.143162 type:complete len:871 (+) Transcript_43002:417-3029(+)
MALQRLRAHADLVGNAAHQLARHVPHRRLGEPAPRADGRVGAAVALVAHKGDRRSVAPQRRHSLFAGAAAQQLPQQRHCARPVALKGVVPLCLRRGRRLRQLHVDGRLEAPLHLPDHEADALVVEHLRRARRVERRHVAHQLAHPLLLGPLLPEELQLGHGPGEQRLHPARGGGLERRGHREAPLPVGREEEEARQRLDAVLEGDEVGMARLRRLRLARQPRAPRSRKHGRRLQRAHAPAALVDDGARLAQQPQQRRVRRLVRRQQRHQEAARRPSRRAVARPRWAGDAQHGLRPVRAVVQDDAVGDEPAPSDAAVEAHRDRRVRACARGAEGEGGRLGGEQEGPTWLSRQRLPLPSSEAARQVAVEVGVEKQTLPARRRHGHARQQRDAALRLDTQPNQPPQLAQWAAEQARERLAAGARRRGCCGHVRLCRRLEGPGPAHASSDGDRGVGHRAWAVVLGGRAPRHDPAGGSGGEGRGRDEEDAELVRHEERLPCAVRVHLPLAPRGARAVVAALVEPDQVAARAQPGGHLGVVIGLCAVLPRHDVVAEVRARLPVGVGPLLPRAHQAMRVCPPLAARLSRRHRRQHRRHRRPDQPQLRALRGPGKEGPLQRLPDELVLEPAHRREAILDPRWPPVRRTLSQSVLEPAAQRVRSVVLGAVGAGDGADDVRASGRGEVVLCEDGPPGERQLFRRAEERLHEAKQVCAKAGGARWPRVGVEEREVMHPEAVVDLRVVGAEVGGEDADAKEGVRPVLAAHLQHPQLRVHRSLLQAVPLARRRRVVVKRRRHDRPRRVAGVVDARCVARVVVWTDAHGDASRLGCRRAAGQQPAHKVVVDTERAKEGAADERLPPDELLGADLWRRGAVVRLA